MYGGKHEDRKGDVHVCGEGRSSNDGYIVGSYLPSSKNHIHHVVIKTCLERCFNWLLLLHCGKFVATRMRNIALCFYWSLIICWFIYMFVHMCACVCRLASAPLIDPRCGGSCQPQRSKQLVGRQFKLIATGSAKNYFFKFLKADSTSF